MFSDSQTVNENFGGYMLGHSRTNVLEIVILCTALMVLTANCAFADFDTDPFYDQRVKLDAPPSDSVNEHIDPFSGNMTIVQTDLHLPGNGGLDLTLMRTYNSLIYSRRDDTLNSYYFVAKKDKSPLGIGWTMHMGILRYPQAPGTQWGGNPILELPDGTKQVFFLDKNDTTRKISKDFWTLKTIAVYDSTVTAIMKCVHQMGSSTASITILPQATKPPT